MRPSVLTISSSVAAGPVGNSAIVPALLSLGVTPVALTTIILSNHPGHGRPAGLVIDGELLGAMIARLESLGFLDSCRVVLTGYFAAQEQVTAVADFLERHAGAFTYLCDPVLGDGEALYVKPEVAQAIRARLVPIADVLLPNAFELGWLTGVAIHDAPAAARAAAQWPDKAVVASSVPAGAALATCLFQAGATLALTRPRFDQVPHGTGDLLSGLLAGRMARGEPLARALEPAVFTLERVIAASAGATALDLTSL